METFSNLCQRCSTEAAKAIPVSRRYILNACLKCIATILNFKQFVDSFGKFIDGQLSSVYQLLESRLIPESDDDLIMIAFNFSRNFEEPMENLIRAIADYRGFYAEIVPHSLEILELVNQVLLKCSKAFRNLNETDRENVNLVKHYAEEIFYLGEVMVLESAKTLSDGEGIDQQAVNSGALACQLIIQV